MEPPLLESGLLEAAVEAGACIGAVDPLASEWIGENVVDCFIFICYVFCMLLYWVIFGRVIIWFFYAVGERVCFGIENVLVLVHCDTKYFELGSCFISYAFFF